MPGDDLDALARVADAMSGGLPEPQPEPDPFDAAFARGLRGEGTR